MSLPLSASPNAIETRDLEKSFGNVRALAGVTLTIPAGSSFAIVGENGAGKTTLFSLIAGYLRPTRGELSVFAAPAGHHSLKGKIGILPQDAQFLPNVSVGEQLRFQAELLHSTRDAAARDAVKALEAVGLPEIAARNPRTLSHGMYKRAGLAQALLGQPQLLLLDEPTAGLDVASARAVRDLVRSLREKATVLVSSHNLVELEDLCEHIAILHRGRVVEQGSLRDFLQRENCLTIVLDAPSGSPISFAADQARALPGVSQIAVRQRPGELRITVELAPNTDLATAQIALVRFLADQGLAPRSITRGRPLEDRMIEMT